jgi:EAL domain-containing protein (putative c-di-GMP-specific phosphodiesterase class I)
VDLRFMGIHLHLDDFGTGYSSLSYLRHFPINAIKVDRSFVSSLPATRDGEVIVRAIVMLAHNLEMNVVAEGVETPEQLGLLRQLGCEFAQGYHFARPLPKEAAGAVAASDRYAWQCS